MIKINKGNSPPSLINKGNALNDANKLGFDNHTNAYLTGKKSFDFSDGNYRSDIVKTELINCHHNKCCFSEAKFNGDYSHVEHFRPKGRVDDWGTKKTQYPGYYWLAYDWSNLFLCKSRINTTYKQNFFPLSDEAQRNRTHNDTNIEDPLIIDPSIEDPRTHIKFHNDEPVHITSKGQFNIEFLGLRHSEFEEARRKKLHLLKSLRDAVDLLIASGINPADPVLTDLIGPLRLAVKPTEEFSSMALDFLKGWPHL